LVTSFDELTFETLNMGAIEQLRGRKVSDLGFSDFLRKAEWLAKKAGEGFRPDRPMDADHQPVFMLSAFAGYSVKCAGIFLRALRPYGGSRRQCCQIHFGGGTPSPVGSRP
jgi:hypothetical protein